MLGRPTVALFPSLTSRSPLLQTQVQTFTFTLATLCSSSTMATKEYYRKDGVRITHDPYANGMEEKYGGHGDTDPDGFDPYADTVGAGIYGGNVQRDASGEIIIGTQYQSHNSVPGPIYDCTGYTAMSNALRHGEVEIQAVLDTHPALVNEVSTGGATPLHMCGMGNENQMATAFLIKKGADINARDTYGYTPLHRMASNNLEVGAKALLDAGADPRAETKHGETPMSIARSSQAGKVASILAQHLGRH